jgi:solute carrier family 25 (mitochondrial ornithine transporter) member 2/15
MLDPRDTFSGAIGAACLTYSGTPFEVVKLRLQTCAPNTFASALHCARALVRAEGLRALWRGALPSLSGNLIDNMVLFTIQRKLCRLVSGSEDERALTYLQHALVGGAAALFSATAICPAELIKCRMMAAPAAGAGGGYKLFAHTLREEGVRGIFRGLGPLLLRDVPLQFLFFGSYQVHSYVLSSLIPSNDPGLAGLRIWLAGGLAGSTAWTVIFPLDVIKSRMQVSTATSNSMLATSRALLAESGVRGFYKGWSMAVLRAFPANASLIWGVELSSALLKQF